MNLQLLRISHFLAFFMLGSIFAFAQESSSLSEKYPKNSKVLYKTIELKEETGKIIVNIDKDQHFQYDYWEGDAILIEQEIQLENAPNSVFNELMRKKRYTITELFQSDALILKYEAKLGKDILVNYKNVNEKIFLKLLVPEKIGVELKQG